MSSPNVKEIFRAIYDKFAKEDDYMEKLHGEFLLLLIRIINEKWLYTSDMTREKYIRRVLIHQLALAYTPWSKLLRPFKNMNWEGADISMAEDMLKELADIRRVTSHLDIIIKQYVFFLLGKWQTALKPIVAN